MSVFVFASFVSSSSSSSSSPVPTQFPSLQMDVAKNNKTTKTPIIANIKYNQLNNNSNILFATIFLQHLFTKTKMKMKVLFTPFFKFLYCKNIKIV